MEQVIIINDMGLALEYRVHAIKYIERMTYLLNINSR